MLPIPTTLLWKLGGTLLAVASVVASVWYYGHVQYNEGKRDADTTWTKKYNDMVDKSNASIKEWEDLANSEAIRFEKEQKQLKGELAEIKRNRPASVNTARNADGSLYAGQPCLKSDYALSIKGVPTMFYLDPSFATEWDLINTTINNKLQSLN
jgi:hypothetical protein